MSPEQEERQISNHASQGSEETPHTDSLPDITICIVSWNRADLLEQCLQSIYETDQDATFEVIVVDNASADSSPDMVSRLFPQVQILVNADNRGFGRANNQAIEIGRGRYFLILNPDTLLMDRTLDQMIAFLEDHPRAAVVTGKVYESNSLDEVRISYDYRDLTPGFLFRNDLATVGGLHRIFPGNDRIAGWVWGGSDPEIAQRVSQVTGAFMGVRREAIDEVGMFDERYFLYMEETDWCRRFRQAGWEIHYTPDSAIVHISEGSSQLRTDRNQLYYNSIKLYLHKHFGWSGRLMYQCQENLLFGPLRHVRRFLKRLQGSG